MLSIDLSPARIQQLEEDLEASFDLDKATVFNSPLNGGITIHATLPIEEEQDDLFQEEAKELAGMISKRVSTKFNTKVAKILFINSLPPREKYTVDLSKETLSSIGDDRDEIVERLASARDSLTAAVDSLLDAASQAEQGMSDTIAENIRTIINVIDAPETSVITSIRDLIRKLKGASLDYSEESTAETKQPLSKVQTKILEAMKSFLKEESDFYIEHLSPEDHLLKLREDLKQLEDSNLSEEESVLESKTILYAGHKEDTLVVKSAYTEYKKEQLKILQASLLTKTEATK